MKEFASLREDCVCSEKIFDGVVLHVRKDDVRLPDGSPSVREYLRHGGAVCVVPLLEDGRVIMERQFRYPMGAVITEIPAGKLNSPGEAPELGARRELREETGAVAGEMIHLGEIYPACAYSSEVLNVYLARDIHFEQQALDADEFLNVFTVPLDELVASVLAGEIPDAKTQIAVLKAWHYLNDKEMEK